MNNKNFIYNGDFKSNIVRKLREDVYWTLSRYNEEELNYLCELVKKDKEKDKAEEPKTFLFNTYAIKDKDSTQNASPSS